MKIGFDAKRAFLNTTGLGNYSRDLIRSLVQNYPDNHYYLFTPKVEETDFYRWAKEQPQVYVVAPSGLKTGLARAYWRSFSLLRLANEFELDIFHGLSGELPKIPKKNQVKTVVTIHDLIFLRYPQQYNFLDRILFKKKVDYAVKKANKVVAISNQTHIDIGIYIGLHKSKVEVIYQTCHPVFFTPKKAEKVQDLPERYLLYVGTIEERKNLISLIKALPLIPEIHLVVVGKDSSYRQEVDREIAELNLSNRVMFFKGLTMEQLAFVYQKASVFIYPSVFEGFGIPIIESLFSGVPVVTNKDGCFPEAGGPDSVYVNVHKPEEIAEAVLGVLTDEIRRKQIIESGKIYAQKFLPDVAAGRWVELYTNLVEQ